MPPPQADPEFEALLDYLKHSRGCDLTGYKRSTLMRRFEYRMQQIRIDSYQNYLQYLQSCSREHLTLLQEVLINFTSFFRDSDTWVYLATEIIPKLISNQTFDQPIRVWSAGCSTGQEICSVLILISEALGVEFCLQHIQCYATDADKDALQQAQKASYSDFEVIDIPPELLEKYFQRIEKSYVFHPELHQLIDFRQHDLMQDDPIPEIDLLICRNVLIYFTVEAQAGALYRFHTALKDTGFLFLGQAEMLVYHKHLFKSIHAKQRFYIKEPSLALENNRSVNYGNPFWRTVFETSAIAQVILDRDGHLINANQRAILLFELTHNDLQRPFQALETGKIIPPDALTNTFNYNRATVLKDSVWIAPEGARYFDIEIISIFNAQNQQFENIVSFLETTNHKYLEAELEHTNSKLEETSRKLQELELELKAAQQKIELLTRIFDGN